MSFTTFSFILFFAALFLLYYRIPSRFQWILLLGASWLFYAFASPGYLLLVVGVIGWTYWGATGIGRVYEKRDERIKGVTREEKRAIRTEAERSARLVLSGVVIGLVLLLGFFKYLQFAYDNLRAVLNVLPLVDFSLPTHSFSIILPVGLSFYVFQTIGYCVDVYREMEVPERNFWRYSLFVSYFPQILQGPIGNYGRLSGQLFAGHQFEYDQAVLGLQRVGWGFFKKLMVANHISLVTDPIWANYSDCHGWPVWTILLVLYAIWIYADFSGYMDIACGCSQMLGIKIDENFNCPYLAKNIPDYWRRWHMTLSSWFRDYLFYPVLRSDFGARIRKFLPGRYLPTLIPTTIALSIVWFTTGLWHGASWGYVAWGLYYGVFMILAVVLEPVYTHIRQRFPNLTDSRGYAVFQVFRTFAIVVIGYALFAPGDLSVSWVVFRRMGEGICQSSFVDFCRPHWRKLIIPFVGSLAMLAVDVIHYCSGEQCVVRRKIRAFPFSVRWTVYLLSLLAMFLWGAYGIASLNKFAYFQF